MREQKIEPSVPFAEMPLVIEWLMDVGPVGREGGDRGPLSWREINAWCDGTGTDLAPWQRKLIRRLSAVYAAETTRAEDPEAPAPGAAAPIDRKGVGDAVRNALAGFKNRRA